MNLRNLRIEFVRRSGRRDLVKTVGEDAYVDNGANAYINRGQRLLDSLIRLPHHERVYTKVLALGDYKVTFANCRTVRRVWCAKAGEGKWELGIASQTTFRSQWATGDFSEVTPGPPVAFTPLTARLAAELSAMTSDDFVAGGFADYGDYTLGTSGDESHIYNGILFMPPADDLYTIRVEGLWWTEPMVDDEALTWWSVNEDDLLEKAALTELESDYRNTEGVNDFLNSMKPRLEALDFDSAEQESQGITTIMA